MSNKHKCQNVIRDKQVCQNVISDTFIMCGEGGNYCSIECFESACKVGEIVVCKSKSGEDSKWITFYNTSSMAGYDGILIEEELLDANGERYKFYEDCGIFFETQYLDQVIEMLQKIRDSRK